MGRVFVDGMDTRKRKSEWTDGLLMDGYMGLFVVAGFFVCFSSRGLRVKPVVLFPSCLVARSFVSLLIKTYLIPAMT